MRSAAVWSFLLILVGALCPIQAGTILDGQSLLLTYEFPSTGSIFDSRTVVVGPGVEAASFPTGDPRTNIDFSDTNIYVTYRSSGQWTGTAFNGFHIFDVNGTIPDITSVTINPATNMAGLDAARVTFDANNIWVNWQDLSFNTSTIVSLDIEGSAVPEPASAALIGLGLIGLGLAGRRLR